MTSVAAARRDDAHGTLPRRRIIGPARAVCRLTMAINGVDYRVEPSPAGAYAVTKAYRLSKPDGTAYDVALTELRPHLRLPRFHLPPGRPRPRWLQAHQGDGRVRTAGPKGVAG